MALEIYISEDVNTRAMKVVTLKLSGSLDSATAPDLEKQLAPVLGSGVRDLVFDLEHLKFISSAGLRVFAATRKVLKGRGGQAAFGGLQPQVREVFDIIRSLGGIAFFKNPEEMDRYITERQKAIDPSSVE